VLRLPSFTESLEVARGWGRNSEAPHLWDGLVANWNFLQGGGSTLYNIVQGNNGTLTNMDPATDWVSSANGWALDFEAGTQAVDLNAKVLPDTSQWTISSWCYWSDVAQGYVCCDSVGVTNFLIQRNTSHGIQMYVDGVSIGASSALTTSRWHHVACTLNGGTAIGYVDGSQYATAGGKTWTGMVGNLWLGNRAGFARDWIGLIGASNVWSRDLQPSEIQQLYEDPHAMHRRRPTVVPFVEAAPAVGNPWNYYAQQTAIIG
jgi:hypothetical protein